MAALKAICLCVTHRMFNMLNPKMEVWKMIVLSIECYLGSQPFIFRGEGIECASLSAVEIISTDAGSMELETE